MNSFIQKYSNLKTLLLLSPVLLFIFVYTIIGFNGLYGQDSHEYYRYSRGVLNFFKTGNLPGDYFWPVYYPIFGAIIGLVLDNLVSLQLISILSLSGSLFFLFRIMNEIFGNNKNLTLYLLITFFLSPYVLRSSVVVMADLMTVFFITASFYFFIDYLHKTEVKQISFFSIFFTLAVLTRYAAAVVLMIPALIVIYHIIKNGKFFHLLVPVVIALILSTPHILIRESKVTEFLGHSWLQEWSVTNFFKNTFITVEGTQHYRFVNLLNSFSSVFYPTYLVFGIVLIVLAERNLTNNRFWLFSLFALLVAS